MDALVGLLKDQGRLVTSDVKFGLVPVGPLPYQVPSIVVTPSTVGSFN